MTKNKKIFFRLLGALTAGGALVANSCVAKEAKKVVKDYTTHGSKIDNGKGGRFFEDSNGNLGAMGWWRRLQVLTRKLDGSYTSSGSTDPNHRLLKGSNIINGLQGFIFEDSSGNLWAMGKGTSLQVLVKEKDGSYAPSWHSDRTSGLTKGSKIINGHRGTIFEDSRGNIGAMASETPLQVLAKNSDGTYAKSGASDLNRGLTKNSLISDGAGGQIIEDGRGNIWSKSDKTEFQVLAKNSDGTYEDSGFPHYFYYSLAPAKSSVIFTSKTGKIFKDSNGNIGAMAQKEPLWVLAKNADGEFAKSGVYDTSHDLLKGSNITDGHLGVIFKDSNGNLGAAGRNTPLQVLVKKTDGTYVDSGNSPKAQKLLVGSNIKDGSMGIIFEDTKGNIFSVGNGTPLQVLSKKQDGSFALSGTSDKSHPLLKGSNVPSSFKARIFQDSKGNTWAMLPNRPIQVG